MSGWLKSLFEDNKPKKSPESISQPPPPSPEGKPPEPTPEEAAQIIANEIAKTAPLDGLEPGLVGLYKHYYCDPRWMAAEFACTKPLDYMVDFEKRKVLWFDARALEQQQLESLRGAEIKTLRLILNTQDAMALDTAEALLKNLARTIPVWLTYSLVGTRQQAYCAFTAPATVLDQLQQIILTYFPNTELAWHDTTKDITSGTLMIMGTWLPSRTFAPLKPLTDFTPDSLAPLFAFFERLEEGETISLSFSFRPAHEVRQHLFRRYAGMTDLVKVIEDHDIRVGGQRWEQIMDSKERQALIDAKFKHAPLWDVDIFSQCCAPTHNRAADLTVLLEPFFQAYDQTCRLDPPSPPLMPLSNPGSRGQRPAHSIDIPYRLVVVDPNDPEAQPIGWELWDRNILSTRELLGFVHLPHKSIASPILLRSNKRRKPAPDFMLEPEGVLLGQNEYFGETKQVYLPHKLRSRHLYVIGASGSGKSTLLIHSIKQDIEAGAGLAVLDPHGDLIDDVLPHIPPERITDVIHFNPADREHVAPFNVLAGAKSPEEYSLIADGVIVSFRRLVESWGERMEHILRMTVYTLIDVGGKTFADIERMLVDEPFRESVVAAAKNPMLLRFWHQQFPNLPKNALDPIINKFTKFLNPLDSTRLIFTLPETKIDFPSIMQGRKIFLANLSQGQLGLDFAQLLGSLIISQLQMAAMRRAAMPADARVPFTLYVDEFQNYVSDEGSAFEKILSEARKYNLQLVLAHQFTSQINGKVLDAIIGNVHTKVAFSVGVDDAAYLQKAFMGFDAEALQNFDIGEAAVNCGRAENSFNLKTYPPPQKPADNQVEAILAHSHAHYTIPLAEALEREAQQFKPPAAAAAAADDEELFGRA